MERGKNIKLFEFCVLPNVVTSIRDQIGVALKEGGCSEQLINRSMFIFEELFMMIYDCNAGKSVCAECAVEIGETIRLITKDDGQIVVLTETDRNVTSLRSYALSNMLESHTTRRMHSLVLSYNHNALEIR